MRSKCPIEIDASRGFLNVARECADKKKIYKNRATPKLRSHFS